MKMSKKIIAFMLMLSLTVLSNIIVVAHNIILNLDYDECIVFKDEYGFVVPLDGDDELWYWLVRTKTNNTENIMDDTYWSIHIDDDVTTIKYYFEESAKNDEGYTWTTDIYKEYIKTMSHDEAMVKAEETAELIKESYVNSMKKWNSIYYYSYDENGNRNSNKVITVIEGTENDHNLSIYPIDYYCVEENHPDNIDYLASVFYDGEYTSEETNESIDYHRHYNNWGMNVNVNFFYEHEDIFNEENSNYNVSSVTSDTVDFCMSATGAHELGHILGLCDVDNICSSGGNFDHHEEILMGYGNGTRSTYAKYKDIAGVSITRGFHTDSDHIWMLRRNTDGTNDVICALCNGVRYNITLTLDSDNNPCYESNPLNVYKSCVHHGGTNEKMLLVATDGIRNFFKCLYCRHIEEVEISTYNVATQYQGFIYSDTILGIQDNYGKIVISDTSTYTFKANTNNGLIIGLYDENLNNTNKITSEIFSDDGCEVILSSGTYYLRIQNGNSSTLTVNIAIEPPPHTHSYTEWAKYTKTHHIECCECGLTGTVTEPHAVKATDLLIANCIDCGEFVNLKDTIVMVPTANANKVTLNGSYILQNGIIVLVDEDVEAYLDGTLVWYDKDNLPVSQ